MVFSIESFLLNCKKLWTKFNLKRCSFHWNVTDYNMKDFYFKLVLTMFCFIFMYKLYLSTVPIYHSNILDFEFKIFWHFLMPKSCDNFPGFSSVNNNSKTSIIAIGLDRSEPTTGCFIIEQLWNELTTFWANFLRKYNTAFVDLRFVTNTYKL